MASTLCAPAMESPTQSFLALEGTSPTTSSPPSLSYSPGSFDTPSSVSSASSGSPVGSLCTASSSLPGSPSSLSSNGKVIRRQTSRIRRKPAPRLTLDEELALLDNEARQVPSEDVIEAKNGVGLLPALEVKSKAAPPSKAPTGLGHCLYSLVPDPPSAIMLPQTVNLAIPPPLPIIIATPATTKLPQQEDEPASPIPPDSPSVSEVAIQWYSSPNANTATTKRFRLPSDVVQDFGSPSAKYGASVSCRSSMAPSIESDYGSRASAGERGSGYDSEELDDEKRASIATDTFGPNKHIRECKTGMCGYASDQSESEEEDGKDISFVIDQDTPGREYVSAIPVPASASLENFESEETDVVEESIRLSEYRWLPKRFIDHKEGRKQTNQSFSTSTTVRFPRSRSPTYETDTTSFVTAAEDPNTPSELSESGIFETPRLSNVSRLPRPFISTSPSSLSLVSESGHSEAATVTASEVSNENESIFDTPAKRSSAFMRHRDSIYSIASDPATSNGVSPRSMIPGRKISLNANMPTRPSYTAATMRWDQINVDDRQWKNGVRKPYLKDNPSFVDEFPPPPAGYQGYMPQLTPPKQRRNIRPSTAPELSTCKRMEPIPEAPQEKRRKAFSLVMRELLAFHEASVKARQEAARVKAEKKAAAKRAMNLYTYQRPEQADMKLAAECTVYTSTGAEVRFGDLYEGSRTIVCFIRHYWCPSCQDYLASVMRVEPEQLRMLNLQLIIIGCGNWKMIEGYRKALGGCEFPIYSDPTREIYKHLGMTLSTMAAGPRPAYTKHGLTANTLISLKRNMAMPLKNPGDLNGLGGEFVLGPGKGECSYAHRMKTTRDHAELSDILKAIGMTIPKQLNLQVQQAEALRRARSAEEIRVHQVQQKRAESIRRKRARALKPGRVVVTVIDNPHLKESSVQTV